MGKIAPEMLETEYETFDTLVCDVFFTCRFYFRQVFFVYDFVGLKVQKPVAGAVHFGKVGLLGIDRCSRIFIGVPNSFDDLYLRHGGLKGADLLQGIVRGVAYGYYILIDDVHDRGYRFGHGITEPAGVAYEGECA